MTFVIRNHLGAQITRGTFEYCEEIRRHHLDLAEMKRYRLLSYIFDNRAGVIAFRTALDRRNEAICMQKAREFRTQLATVRKEIAYYRTARPVEVARRAA